MMNYGVIMNMRYTLKQKEIFFEDLKQQIVDKDKKISLQSARNKKGTVVNNIVIGDLNKAKTIIAAAYDTPSQVLIPNYLYYPLNIKKNLNNEYLNSSVLFFGIYLIIKDYASYDTFMKVVVAFISISMILIGYLILKNRPNKVNFNRNSASVALTVALINQNIKNSKVAYVLLDSSVTSYNGLKHLNANIKPDVEIILLDSLSAGETLILAHSIDTNEQAKMLCSTDDLKLVDKTYVNDQLENNLLAINKQILYLVSGTITNQQFVVKHTRSNKDRDYDNDRLIAIRDLLIAYIEGRNYDNQS